MSIERPEQSPPIVWAVRKGKPDAHPVPKPVVGRIVDAACGEPFFANSFSDTRLPGYSVCRRCKEKYLGDAE